MISRFTALRAMHVVSETWGDKDHFYLKAAVKFADEFEHWGGFGGAAAATADGEGGKYGYPEYQ